MEPTDQPTTIIDPDPFSVGIAVFGAIAGAGAWLEARRQRSDDQIAQRRNFRATWFACLRSVDFLDSSIRELATHVAEQEFGDRIFRFGSVRIGFTSTRARESFARLSRQVDITKANLTENFDHLSDYLGPDDAQAINQLMEQLSSEIGNFPFDYNSLINSGRIAVQGLREFLQEIGNREGFRV